MYIEIDLNIKMKSNEMNTNMTKQDMQIKTRKFLNETKQDQFT